MFSPRKRLASVLLSGALTFILSSCAASPPVPSAEASSDIVSVPPIVSVNTPPYVSDTISPSPANATEKGLYTIVTVDDILVGLTFPGSDEADGTAIITWQKEYSQINVALSDGSTLSKRFDSNYFKHHLLYLSAGDLDYDGYDELVIFLEASDSTYGGGIPIVLKVENGKLVEMESPLDCITAGYYHHLPEFDPDLCNGAVAFDKGTLRLTTEYLNYTGEELFNNFYDLRYFNDNWYVWNSGILALNKAAEYDLYKDEIVNIHNSNIKGKPWLDEIEKTDIVTSQVRKGLLSEYGEATVILFEIMLYDGSPWPHIPVYVIECNEESIISYWADEEDAPEFVYSSAFSLRDVDGDGYCEIIAQYDTGGNGGFGGYVSAIYKVENGMLKQLFSSCSTGWFDFDTGFTLSLDDGFLCTVRNKYTSFETKFTRKRYGTPYFDDDGRVLFAIAEDEMMVDSFYIFMPIDIDNDGTYEIMTAQYCSLWGHVDGVGSAYTILKYDNNAGEMKVVKAGFWKFIDDEVYDVYDDETYDVYYEQWSHYERNWYMG